MTARPKYRYVRSKSIRQSARGMPCSWCGRNDGTIVWAHSNQQEHGKGMSIKATDTAGAYLCRACHAELDQGRGSDEARAAMFAEAAKRSARWAAAKGIRP